MDALAAPVREAPWYPTARKVPRRPQEIAGPAAPNETLRCLLRCVCTLPAFGPPNSRGSPCPTGSWKIPQLRAENRVPPSHSQAKTKYRGPNTETATYAHIRPAPANTILATPFRARFAVPPTPVECCDPPFRTTPVASRAHSSRRRTARGCVAVRRRLVGRVWPWD